MNYKEAKSQTLENLFANILLQLVLRNSVAIEKVTTLYESHVKEKTRPSLNEYTKILQAVVGGGGLLKMFVVIDALDECPELDGNRSNFLYEIRKLQPDAHLLFTSRPERNIELEFQSAARLEILASDEDITKYLEARIPSSSNLTRHLKKDPNLLKVIIENVIDRAKGM
jgi:hypothetical protein